MKFQYKSFSKQDVQRRIDDRNNPNRQRNIFKAKEQAQTVRIVPYIHNDRGNPFIEKNFHYNMAGGTIVCPTTYGETCPICEFASSLWKKGEKDMAKKFFKSDRVYVPVIVRNGDKVPKFWGVSRTNYQQILNTIADPDYGDVVHPMEGRDLTVTKIPGGQYGKVAIKFKPKSTPIAQSQKEIQEILTRTVNFDTVYPLKKAEELTVILEKTINALSNRPAEGSSDKGGAQPNASKASGDKAYISQIDQALNN